MTNSYVQPDDTRKWLVMAAVGTGVFLGTIDASIINVSLPTLMEALHTDFPTIQWVILSYLLTITSLLLSVGRLADIRGKKKIYLIGFVIFTTGSALAGLSPNASWLIAFRVLQAVGAAMVTALGAAIVTAAFPPTERGKALGIIGTIVSGGIATGPALGGLLIGTIFAARAAVYAGHAVSADLNTAGDTALVGGLQDAMTVVAVMMFIATLISGYGFWMQRNDGSQP